ncbi:peptidase inhibitor family I36 protein [Streptomyces sp. NPDC093085]|uniref:peptidase inhibitor family I36 protein n=1 Tax=Streptomyces sp. NPDC093085 TaxID=3155068 RepID=UPI0034481FC4
MSLRKVKALVVAGTAVLATLATITPSTAAPACEANAICLWTKKNGGGQLLVWKGGYRDLPAEFHDHVYSFRANRSGAFINYNNGTKECRTVRAGDYADNYDQGFGKLMDAIGDNC